MSTLPQRPSTTRKNLSLELREYGQSIRAQAAGDYQALKQRGRVLRIKLGRDTAAGIRRLQESLVA